jgi:MraZ protein
MLLFTGEHQNKVDRKGRVSLPSDFRAELPEGEDRFIYIYPSPKRKMALEAVNRAQLESLSESIDSFGFYTAEQEYFSSVILGRARKLSIDGEGRIVLPEDFRKESEIDDSALFVGSGKLFHIWHPDRYKEYAASVTQVAPGFSLPPVPPRGQPS